ncbi:MAG TPA: hypothetical protein VHG28_14160 [Longimicrobiaceae bacterium]|nr:hypothetical protein [Longimicrobiaceae bacterium]
MAPWTGVVLVRGEPGDDRMESRLPTFLHPLAGRPLAWHALAALAALQPAPRHLYLVTERELTPDPLLDSWEGLRLVEFEGRDLRSVLASAGGTDDRVLVVDARAPLLDDALQPLLEAPCTAVLVDADGRPAAASLSGELLDYHLGEWNGLAAVAAADVPRQVSVEGALVVRDRGTLARASERIRDRLVARLMEGGVTFVLPQTVWVDLDVNIGRDSVIYPGVVLEGRTTIGEETVVGPGCRIVDSWVGSGVELKGWNYLSHTSIRNRAILEPYARRGFD